MGIWHKYINIKPIKLPFVDFAIFNYKDFPPYIEANLYIGF